VTVIDSHGVGGEEHLDHPPFLAHHWNTPQQQFEAGKLGMWLFLATEFLLFGGLFCAYAVFRFNNPEIFAYGSQFLDTTWGAINTVVLIASSLTMALAVSASQLGKTKALIVLLCVTFLGGLGFMCIKYVEYKHKFEDNIVWGTGFYETPEAGHGSSGAEQAAAAGSSGATHDDGAVATEEVIEVAPAAGGEDGFVMTRSAVVPAAAAPTGIALGALDAEIDAMEGDSGEPHDTGHPAVHHSVDPDRPPNAHIFFGIYFCMTGLHGIHVLAGMGMIAWLIVRSAKGHFGPAYFTPVDLGGLYWHVVDLIWIFLFPLLYLI